VNVSPRIAHRVTAGQQRGAGFARRAVAREDSAWPDRCGSHWCGRMLVGFVVVDSECSVVPLSL